MSNTPKSLNDEAYDKELQTYEDEGERPYIKHICTLTKCQINLNGFCNHFEPKKGE